MQLQWRSGSSATVAVRTPKFWQRIFPGTTELWFATTGVSTTFLSTATRVWFYRAATGVSAATGIWLWRTGERFLESNWNRCASVQSNWRQLVDSFHHRIGILHTAFELPQLATWKLSGTGTRRPGDGLCRRPAGTESVAIHLAVEWPCL